MFDWIPIHQYTNIYYYVMLIVVLNTFIRTQAFTITSINNLMYTRSAGVYLGLFVLFYMGLRPIHIVFMDMTTYATLFERYQYGNAISTNKEYFFHFFVQFCSKIMSVNMFFMLCGLLYVVPLYIVCKKWFKQYWFYGFLMLVVSFSFWAAGTNGIRNAISGSIFLLGISREKRVFQILWLVLAVNFHLSIILPIALFAIVQIYNNPKYFLLIWIISIPLSLIMGSYFQNIFAGLGFGDRLSYLNESMNRDNFSSTGFRWDFLIYSASGVFSGWYYIFVKKFKDPIYFKLFNIYLGANAFWVLIIRANFSNRFAYLSWFMLALIIIYPLLVKKIMPNQSIKIGYIILVYFTFTFLMNIILA